MTAKLRFTITGCGSSPGVPRVNGDWGACDPANPKNRRRRASLLMEKIADNGSKTVVVVDTGPDFREQMISAGVTHIDGVVYTHPHADHIHGIDDLRTYVVDQKSEMNIYANQLTLDRLYEGFSYCFKTPEGSSYPPILLANEIRAGEEFSINGAAGEINLQVISQIHGDIESLGFRIGDVAYCTDVSDFPEGSEAYLQNLDVLIIDALQYRSHASHFSLDEALEWAERLAPKRVILTHMHVPLDYDAVMKATPDYVEPAYDGLAFEIKL